MAANHCFDDLPVVPLCAALCSVLREKKKTPPTDPLLYDDPEYVLTGGQPDIFGAPWFIESRLGFSVAYNNFLFL